MGAQVGSRSPRQRGSLTHPYVGILRSPGLLLPSKLRNTFRFQRIVPLTSGAGGYAFEYYSMNSPYDPLFTVGGGICTGWTTLMTLYSRCFVRNATCQMQPTTASHTSDVAFVLPIRSDEAAAGIVPTFDMVTEGQLGKFNLTTNSVYLSQPLVDRRSPAEFQGLGSENNPSNKEQLSAAVSTDPTIQPCWAVGLIGSAGHTLSMGVFIEYDSELYRPNALGDA